MSSRDLLRVCVCVCMCCLCAPLVPYPLAVVSFVFFDCVCSQMCLRERKLCLLWRPRKSWNRATNRKIKHQRNRRRNQQLQLSLLEPLFLLTSPPSPCVCFSSFVLCVCVVPLIWLTIILSLSCLSHTHSHTPHRLEKPGRLVLGARFRDWHSHLSSSSSRERRASKGQRAFWFCVLSWVFFNTPTVEDKCTFAERWCRLRGSG